MEFHGALFPCGFNTSHGKGRILVGIGGWTALYRSSKMECNREYKAYNSEFILRFKKKILSINTQVHTKKEFKANN